MTEARWQASPLLRLSLAVHILALLGALLLPHVWPWALAALALNHLLLAAVGLWPRSQALGPNWIALPSAAVAAGQIALTLDDGPDPAVTPLVLDLLERHQVRATFFCIGEKAQRYPDLCRAIVARGHALENHSQHHRHNFSMLGLASMRREIQAGQDTLTAITGQRPAFFRAPAGLRNPFLDPVLSTLGLQLASWSVRGFDTCSHDAERVQARLLRGLRAGAIVLLHDGNAARTQEGQPLLLAVLPGLLQAAADAGLHWVTLRQANLTTPVA